MIHYVHVLSSIKDVRFYIGYTTNLKSRLTDHNAGMVFSTKHRSPFELIYHEGCRHQEDALRRERYLKSTYGKRYIKSRIKCDLDV